MPVDVPSGKVPAQIQSGRQQHQCRPGPGAAAAVTVAGRTARRHSGQQSGGAMETVTQGREGKRTAIAVTTARVVLHGKRPCADAGRKWPRPRQQGLGMTGSLGWLRVGQGWRVEGGELREALGSQWLEDLQAVEKTWSF